MSIRDLAHKMVDLAGFNPSFIQYGQPRAGDIFRSCLSNKKIKTSLNWSPSVSIEEGLKETLDFFFHL